MVLALVFLGANVFATGPIDPPTKKAVVEEAAVILDESAAELEEEVDTGQSIIHQEGDNQYRLVKEDGSGVTVILDDKL